MRFLYPMLLVLAPCALAQNVPNQPAANAPNPPLNLPARNAPAIDQPGGPLPAAEGHAVERLNSSAMPIEDAISMVFMLVAADAQEDLQDLLEEMAASRQEREALRRKYRQARHEARQHDRERREALREARERSREEARDRREKLREQRAALRKEQREARRKKREVLRIYYEARARQGHLAAGLVAGVADQFNGPDGPQPRRVGILLDQVEAQAVKLKDPPPGSKPDEKTRRNDELLAAHIGELRGVWRKYLAATGSPIAQRQAN